jgi:hypothetical protein
MLLIFGLLDMQLSNIRDMLFVSIWVGNLAYLRSYYLPIKPDDNSVGPVSLSDKPFSRRVIFTEFGEQGRKG